MVRASPVSLEHGCSHQRSAIQGIALLSELERGRRSTRLGGVARACLGDVHGDGCTPGAWRAHPHDRSGAVCALLRTWGPREGDAAHG